MSYLSDGSSSSSTSSFLSQVVLYQRKQAGGTRAKSAAMTEYDLEDPELSNLIEADLLDQLREDVELLQVLGECERGWMRECERESKVVCAGHSGE